MKKPMLQIALDNLNLNSALKTLEEVVEVVDILEVGTVLLLATGKQSIRVIKNKYPNKIVLADAKIADAGKIISKMLLETKADIITVICCADIPTVDNVNKIAKYFNKDVQIELTGYWNFEQAKQWKEIGIEQVVYHRSRDSEAMGITWQQLDIDRIQKLCDMGFKVTIAGGVSAKDLDLFKHMPIYIIIVGRAITDTKNPKQTALEFQKLLTEKWKYR